MFLERISKPNIARFVVAGLLIGLVIMAAAVAAYNGSGDARFCGSCHSMNSVYTTWNQSPHRQFTCTECHLPDTNIVGKVVYKTRAGINDLVHEKARDYPARIGLSAHGREIVSGNCFRCHASTVAATPMDKDGADCLQCHRFLVHGRSPDEGGIKIEK